MRPSRGREAHRNVGGARCEQLSIRPVHRRSRRRPTEESQTHLRVATQVFVGGLRASTFDAKSTCPCDLAVMLNVATVSDKPPGIDARADPGGAPWLLLDRAAAAVWYVLVIEGKEWAAYNTCLKLLCPYRFE